MIKSYIWDLDGTLLDSYGSIVSSLVCVARECGMEDESGGILKAVKQGSVSGYLRELAGRSGEEYTELYRMYRTVSHDRLEEIGLIPGTLETLEALRNAGARHFVYTHRGKSTGKLLERLGLTAFFEEIVTFEYGFTPKPSGEGVNYLVEKYALEKAETAYVGDRTLDVECAVDAGVRAILYLPEGSCVEPTGKEDLVIRSLEDLADPAADAPSRVWLKRMTPEMLHRYFMEYENDPDLFLDKEKFAPYVYSRERVEQYIKRYTELKRINLAIMYGENMIGQIILKDIEEHRCATMGLSLKQAKYKDRGFGTQAEKLAVQYVFNEMDIPTLYADAIRTNTRSQHVLEKAGFRLIREDQDFRYYRIDRENA